MDNSAPRSPSGPPADALRCQACGASYALGTAHVCANAQTATVRPEDPARTAATGEEPPDPLIGQVVGERYHILAQVGRGGMGAVFKARHVSLNSMLAIKVLLRPDSPTIAQDVLREAQLASKTHHPNIVQIMDYGLLPDRRPYLVMEFLEGKTLGSVLQEGPIDLLRACRIAVQIARGVQAIHDQGIVHRDLKPDNILLRHHSGNADFVKIVDFGIAKDVTLGVDSLGVDLQEVQAAAVGGTLNQLIEQTAIGKQRTRFDAMVGTPMYMAPEQVRGRQIDGRCDQYALGIILYQMLTGKPPFLADNAMETIFLRLMQQPPPPRQCSPERGISAEFDALTMRCLALEPERRFASMSEVAEALEREVELISLARGERRSINAQIVSLLPERLSGAHMAASPAARRRRRILRGAAVAGTLLVAVVGVWLYTRLAGRRGLSPEQLLAIEQRAVAVLLDCMSDVDTRLRVRALGALANTHDANLRPKLEPWLRVAAPEVQAEAAASLGALGDPAAAPPLTELYQSSKVPLVKMAALSALEQLGDPRGNKLLHDAFTGSDDETRMYAGFVLCERAEPPAVTMLQTLFAAGKLPQPLLLDGLGCLARSGSEPATEKLATLSRSAGSVDAQLGAAAQLLRSGDPRGRARLLELMARTGPERLLAARLLASPEEPERATLFRSLLDDPRAAPEVLILAMEGLGHGGQTEDVLRLLPRLARSDSPLLRQTAAGAIVELAHRDPALLAVGSQQWTRGALADTNWMTRLSATSVLGDSSTAEAVALLARALKDRESPVRRGAAHALGRHKAEPALRTLREGLLDSDLEVRLETLRSLSRVGPRLAQEQRTALRHEVSTWVEPLLSKGSATEQILARGVLVRLGDDQQVARLRTLFATATEDLRVLVVEQLERESRELASFLKDSAFLVRFTAARLLAQQGDKRALPVLTDAVSKGGTTAMLAYGLMRRLGSTVDLGKEAEQLLATGAIEDKLAVVQAWAMLPIEQALALLGHAAYHADARVRMQVVESLADVLVDPVSPAWLDTMQRLSQDRDPVVRARAAVLFVRAKESARTGANAKPVVPPKAPAEPAEDKATAAQPATAPPAVPETAAPETAAAVPKSEERAAGGPAEAERLIQQAQAATEPRRAQKLYDKARVLCQKGAQGGAGCAPVLFEIGVRLGQLYEGQDRPAEAMTEYQSALQRGSQTKGKPELKAAMLSGISRLSLSLGRVVMPKQVKGKCREETVWLPTGTHTLVVEGQSQTIKVTAGTTVRVAGCK